MQINFTSNKVGSVTLLTPYLRKSMKFPKVLVITDEFELPLKLVCKYLGLIFENNLKPWIPYIIGTLLFKQSSQLVFLGRFTKYCITIPSL